MMKCQGRGEGNWREMEDYLTFSNKIDSPKRYVISGRNGEARKCQSKGGRNWSDFIFP